MSRSRAPAWLGLLFLSGATVHAAEEPTQKPPDHYRATISVEYNQTKLKSLGVRDVPTVIDDTNNILSRREFTLQDLENMHIWGSNAVLKDVARFKIAFAREAQLVAEVKANDKLANQERPPAAAAAAVKVAEVEKPAAPPEAAKTVAEPSAPKLGRVAKVDTPPPDERAALPAPTHQTDDATESGATSDSPAFRGRLPNNYSKLGIADSQRQKIYSIQASYDAKISALKKQLSDSLAARDVEVRAVLSAEQQRKLAELSGDAAKAKGTKATAK